MRFASLVTLVAFAATTTAARNATEATTMKSKSLYLFMHGVDIVGKDLATSERKTPDECMVACVQVGSIASRTCSGATWTNYNGGTCWLKATEFAGARTVPTTGAHSFWIRKDVTDVRFTWSGTSNNVDMVGNDLTTTSRDDMSKCRDDCEANEKCWAVVWTNYNKGTCWLKREASSYVAKEGALAAYVARTYF